MKLSNPECVLTLDAGGTAIKLGLVTADTLGGRISELRQVPMPSEGRAAEIEAAYAQATRLGVECAMRGGLEIVGISVSTPGPFDYADGVSLMDHKCAAIKGMSVRGFIQKAAGPVPVRFIHDALAFLLGELAFDPERPHRNPCAATIGTGIGFAAMANGRLLRNSQGGPAISVYTKPYRDGTAEDYVSKRGILGCYRRHGGTGEPSVKDIADRAQNGEVLCAQVFEETGACLAEILAPVICEGGFDRLILGGQIAKSGELLASPVRRGLAGIGLLKRGDAYTVDDYPSKFCVVETARHIDEAPLFGAAQLFLNEEAIL